MAKAAPVFGAACPPLVYRRSAGGGGGDPGVRVAFENWKGGVGAEFPRPRCFLAATLKGGCYHRQRCEREGFSWESCDSVARQRARVLECFGRGAA